MPEWSRLNRDQLTANTEFLPLPADSTFKTKDGRPLAEIKTKASGQIELRTKARIDRSRGGFMGIGHAVARNTKLAFGVVQAKREDAEHGFDKSVDTLIEDVANGPMPTVGFLRKLLQIRKAGIELQATNAAHATGAPASNDPTERFGENLLLGLLAVRQHDPAKARLVLAKLGVLSDGLQLRIDRLESALTAAQVRNGAAAYRQLDGPRSKMESLKAYVAELNTIRDALVYEEFGPPDGPDELDARNDGAEDRKRDLLRTVANLKNQSYVDPEALNRIAGRAPHVPQTLADSAAAVDAGVGGPERPEADAKAEPAGGARLDLHLPDLLRLHEYRGPFDDFVRSTGDEGVSGLSAALARLNASTTTAEMEALLHQVLKQQERFIGDSIRHPDYEPTYAELYGFTKALEQDVRTAMLHAAEDVADALPEDTQSTATHARRLDLTGGQIAVLQNLTQALDSLAIEAGDVDTSDLSNALTRLIRDGQGDPDALQTDIEDLRQQCVDEGNRAPDTKPVMDRLISLTRELDVNIDTFAQSND